MDIIYRKEFSERRSAKQCFWFQLHIIVIPKFLYIGRRSKRSWLSTTEWGHVWLQFSYRQVWRRFLFTYQRDYDFQLRPTAVITYTRLTKIMYFASGFCPAWRHDTRGIPSDEIREMRHSQKIQYLHCDLIFHWVSALNRNDPSLWRMNASLYTLFLTKSVLLVRAFDQKMIINSLQTLCQYFLHILLFKSHKF